MTPQSSKRRRKSKRPPLFRKRRKKRPRRPNRLRQSPHRQKAKPVSMRKLSVMKAPRRRKRRLWKQRKSKLPYRKKRLPSRKKPRLSRLLFITITLRRPRRNNRVQALRRIMISITAGASIRLSLRSTARKENSSRKSLFSNIKATQRICPTIRSAETIRNSSAKCSFISVSTETESPILCCPRCISSRSENNFPESDSPTLKKVGLFY